MVFDGKNLVVHDRNRRAYDTAAGAYVCLWKALERTNAKTFFELSIWTCRLYIIERRRSMCAD